MTLSNPDLALIGMATWILVALVFMATADPIIRHEQHRATRGQTGDQMRLAGPQAERRWTAQLRLWLALGPPVLIVGVLNMPPSNANDALADVLFARTCPPATSAAANPASPEPSTAKP